MSTRHARIDTVLGHLIVVAENDYLVGLYFPDHSTMPPADVLGPEVDETDDALFAETAAQLGEYLTGARTDFDLPTRIRGADFQQQVWELLRSIPYGATTSYGEIADQLGNRRLAQQVGQAVARNPLSIVIPCHRVVGHDGKLTGYAGGLTRKRFLLDLEEPVQVAAVRLL